MILSGQKNEDFIVLVLNNLATKTKISMNSKKLIKSQLIKPASIDSFRQFRQPWDLPPP